MTDKPIIIDGIDVSECIFHSLTTMGYAGYNYCKCFECVCKCHNDCYYKQLKRKEQECEALQMSDNEAREIVAELKAECEELKKELETAYDDCKGCPTCNEALYNANLYAKEYRKLKQTLTEIKDIAEPYCNAYSEFEHGKGRHCKYCNYSKILQKISEVLDD